MAVKNVYKELADLIFPNITETIEDLENRYPKRDLPEGAFVTRFAPSPTGFLHTGSLFAATISWKLATQSKGVFYVRLEDTDQKREIEGSGKDLIDQLAKFDIVPSEGYYGDHQEGDYAPYVQSERENIYKVVIKYMIEHNMAYPCFCSTTELDELRKAQEANKENFGYYGKYAKCSFLTPEEAIERIKNGEPYVIRFRSHGDSSKKVKFVDAIRGEIEIAENDQHIVILKSDNLPTYHFAHLVDDHFMRTTHVTRGEEWMPSVPVHLELFDTMKWERPTYAHLPVIMKLDNGNRRKLSKRKDPEAAVSYFLEQGYPVDGFMEYLFTIANSNFEAWRDENPKAPRSEFKLTFNKMSLDGALFDLAKIQNLCKEKLGHMDTQTFASESYKWAKVYSKELQELIERNFDYYASIVGIEREKENPRKDYEKYSDIFPLIKFFYNDYYEEMFDENFNIPENISKENAIKMLNLYAKKLDLTLDEEEWFNTMKEVAVECGFAATPKEWKKNKEAFPGHVGDLAALLRMVNTLRLQSPNLYYVMKILGKAEVLHRIKLATKKLEENN